MTYKQNDWFKCHYVIASPQESKNCKPSRMYVCAVPGIGRPSLLLRTQCDKHLKALGLDLDSTVCYTSAQSHECLPVPVRVQACVCAAVRRLKLWDRV